MAEASGPAAQGFISGEFDDKAAQAQFRVYQEDQRVWLTYRRESERPETRELLYYIGSGRKGRTYLFSDDGFLFESPINWYMQENRWNMTPGYLQAREVPMNLPALSSCLNCHTSGMQSHVAGTRNRFPGRPFLHDGITCERCHGPGDEHVNGRGPIVNPVKLPPEHRDSICMECHFEGTVSVRQPGKRVSQFQPGDKLSDYLHYFILSGNETRSPESLSQFEGLSLSTCKIKSGDRMWCGTCHDPHREPAPDQKVAYYRGKCLQCHGEAFATRHHADNPDCVGCHMPALPSKEVAHTQATDHRILRRISAPALRSSETETPSLSAFPSNASSLVTKRDLAMAWETMAERGLEGAAPKAESYLREAIKEWPNNAGLLSSYAFVEQERAKNKEAQSLYRRALDLHPHGVVASSNLGLLEAKSGNLGHAVELWQDAFRNAPYQSTVGMYLAMAFCASGQRNDARNYITRVLEFNPDSRDARRLLANINSDPVKCHL